MSEQSVSPSAIEYVSLLFGYVPSSVSIEVNN